MNSKGLPDLLAVLVSSLGWTLGDLDWSLLDELYLNLERLVDLDLRDLHLNLPLGGSLPPKHYPYKTSDMPRCEH